MPPSRTAQTPDPDAQPSGFSEEQRSELRAIIAEVVGGAKPPPQPPAQQLAGPKRLTDSEWDVMSDRQRESWVRQLVDFRLDELSRNDEIAAQRDEIEQLKNAKHPEPEAPPSVVTKLQKFLWGDPEQ